MAQPHTSGITDQKTGIISSHNRNRTVLLIDGDEAHRREIRAIAASEELRLVEVESGEAAMELIKAPPKDINTVILEKDLPELSGIDVIRAMRREEWWTCIPVIMIAGRADVEDIVACVQAGAYYYLSKPYQPRLFLSILNKALNDYMRCKYFTERMYKSKVVSGLIQQGSFRFRTLKEGHEIADFLAGLCPTARDDIVVGFIELLINAVEHGILGIGYEGKSSMLKKGGYIDHILAMLDDPSYKDKSVEVFFRKTEKKLVVEIKDQGNGFNYEQYLKIDKGRLFAMHGRGIAMAKGLYFSNLEYLGCGNHVRVTVNL